MDTEEIKKDQPMDTTEEVKHNPEEEAGAGGAPETSVLEEATESLKEMGYHVYKDEEDNNTKFRQIEDNKDFEFKTKKHYDKLGDHLCDWIQGYMMTYQGMNKVMIPHKDDLKEDHAQAPIFISEDWETNTDKALVLIQGVGDVRSGYWARSVCMNDTLELGSMIPDIEFARKNGFSCLVMNPNYSYTPEKVKVDPIIRGMNYHANF